MRLVWFFAFTSVAAYDDQSLMQQNLGVEHGVSSSEYKRALDNLGAAMQKMPYTGKMRQLAFDSLMQELAQEPQLTADAKKILQDVIDLFDSILAQFKQEKGINQNELDLLTSGVDYCNGLSLTTVTNNEEAFRSAVNASNFCRNTTQAGAFDAASSACYAVLRVIHGHRSNRIVHVTDGAGTHSVTTSCDHWSGGRNPDQNDDLAQHPPGRYCTGTAGNHDCRNTNWGDWSVFHDEITKEEATAGTAFGNVDAFIHDIAGFFHVYPHGAATLNQKDTTHMLEWGRAFDAYESWVNAGIQDLGSNPTKIETCRTKTGLLEAAIDTCDGKQTQAGSKYCLWRKGSLELCGTGPASRFQCYYNHTEAHLGPGGVQERIKPVADKRTEEGKLVEFIRCLVVNLKNELVDISLCNNIVNETKAQEDYNCTYPVNASIDPCPTTAVDGAPSADDAAFKSNNGFNDNLAKAPWYSFADAAQDCSSIGAPNVR